MPGDKSEQIVYERETGILSVYSTEEISAATIVLPQRNVSGSDKAGPYQSTIVGNMVAGADRKYAMGESAAFHENDLSMDSPENENEHKNRTKESFFRR